MLPQPKVAMDTGDLPGALGAFATREMLDYRLHGRCHSDGWVCGFGAVLWLMGDTEGAGRVWSRACDEAFRGKFHYSSTGTFQPGLLLWFASVWLKNDDWQEEALASIDKLLRKRQPVMGAGFPSLIAKFLRRELELSEVQTSYRDKPPPVQRACEWQTLFYAGVLAFKDGKVEETRRLWKQAKKRTDASVVLEYYLLEHARKKLG